MFSNRDDRHRQEGERTLNLAPKGQTPVLVTLPESPEASPEIKTPADLLERIEHTICRGLGPPKARSNLDLTYCELGSITKEYDQWCASLGSVANQALVAHFKAAPIQSEFAFYYTESRSAEARDVFLITRRSLVGQRDSVTQYKNTYLGLCPNVDTEKLIINNELLALSANSHVRKTELGVRINVGVKLIDLKTAVMLHKGQALEVMSDVLKNNRCFIGLAGLTTPRPDLIPYDNEPQSQVQIGNFPTFGTRIQNIFNPWRPAYTYDFEYGIWIDNRIHTPTKPTSLPEGESTIKLESTSGIRGTPVRTTLNVDCSSSTKSIGIKVTGENPVLVAIAPPVVD